MMIELIGGPLDGQLCDLQGREGEIIHFAGSRLPQPVPMAECYIRPGDNIVRYKYENTPRNKKRYVYMPNYVPTEGDPDYIEPGEIGGESEYGPL